MAERTLIIIKPDAVQRHLAGEIISRLERKGAKIIAAKFIHVNKQLARRLYDVHKDKSFFAELVEFITSGPVMAMVWEADEIIATARKMIGRTFGYEARPGTIRGDFGCSARYNLVHASDSAASAEFEIALFFTPSELTTYDLPDQKWLWGPDQ
ncbi:MAG TPA: nucleoside-diphosphate kinase [Planctomycetes bacterium]|nr:nucleoside-diphosphate kinase [Planctomycetota bacterium]HIJ71422.1 nucleoside-diphosphate kinase [Planctomycetota bacterium]